MSLCLIAGLGNPGAKYAGHRHNVGFMVADRFAARFASESGQDPFRARFQGSFVKLVLPRGADVGVLKPATFMNLSGRSVREALQFFKIPLSDLIVVHDELDLPLGTLRIKLDGGTAGHNGLKSIVECCGGDGFRRLRVGIGRPRSGAPQRHVLSDFSVEESAQVEDVLERATAALVDLVELGTQAAMNLHNRSS